MMPQNICQLGSDQLGETSCLDLVPVVRDTSIPPIICGQRKRGVSKEAGKSPKRGPARLPSVSVVMRRGYVDGRYLLTIPRSFCESHLPECDDKVVLVGEDDKEYITEFDAAKGTFGGDGWKEFVVAKKLVHRDALVIEKIRSLKFKVSIRKGPSSSPESLLARHGIGSCASPTIPPASRDMGSGSCHMAVEKAASSRQLTARPDNRSLQTNCTGTTNLRPNNVGTNFSDFSNFKRDLSASDVLINLEENIVLKYYVLCCSQKMYLHSNLLGDWNSAFIAAIILELVDISEEIRCSNLNTPRDLYKKWHIKLYRIESLGMEVGFLQRRLQRLSALACNPKREAKRKRMEEARAGKDNTEAKLKHMQETLNSLNKEIASLETEEDTEICTYLDEARASW